MPPFSSPVSRIMSVRDAPKYPWRLKSWADLANILSRVSSPLLIYLFLSKALAVSLIGVNVGKSGSYFLFQDAFQGGPPECWRGPSEYSARRSGIRQNRGPQRAGRSSRDSESEICPALHNPNARKDPDLL